MTGCGREEVGRARSLGASQGIEPLALALPAGLEPVQARAGKVGEGGGITVVAGGRALP